MRPSTREFFQLAPCDMRWRARTLHFDLSVGRRLPSAMGPPFIDGGSNPFGNKGADLIETIRLEGHRRDGPGIYLLGRRAGNCGPRPVRRHRDQPAAAKAAGRRTKAVGRAAAEFGGGDRPRAQRREAVQRMLHGGGTSDAGGSQPASQQASEIVRSGASPVASHAEPRAARLASARARRRNRGRRGAVGGGGARRRGRQARPGEAGTRNA